MIRAMIAMIAKAPPPAMPAIAPLERCGVVLGLEGVGVGLIVVGSWFAAPVDAVLIANVVASKDEEGSNAEVDDSRAVAEVVALDGLIFPGLSARKNSTYSDLFR